MPLVLRQWWLPASVMVVCLGIWFAGQAGLLDYRSSRDVLIAPGSAHWLGTNELGQDVLTGLILATPTTLVLAVATAMATSTVAIGAASLVVFSGQFLSGMVLRIVDAVQVVPTMLVLLLFAALLNPGFLSLFLILVITGWSDDVRVAAAVLRRERQRENIQYARAMGAGWLYCWRWHLFAALRPLCGVLMVQNIRQAALKSSGLAFLGLTDPRLLTWGSMMQSAMDQLYSGAWVWLLLPPAALLSLLLHVTLTMGDRSLRSAAVPEFSL
ncbi:ABC transporter permease subunit [Phaeobacter sp. JH20_02]|uniref:ABC transporter permease n=1 Tax=unclassified Phaeobacter TaxID=2621772 RepID=UPI003A84D0AF